MTQFRIIFSGPNIDGDTERTIEARDFAIGTGFTAFSDESRNTVYVIKNEHLSEVITISE